MLHSGLLPPGAVTTASRPEESWIWGCMNVGENEVTGLIFDTQQFAVHDGPGCRTMVFMKGCPLACPWCANPEGRSAKQEVMYSVRSCDSTLACVEACPYKAISIESNGYIRINRNFCPQCIEHSCVDVCPKDALRLVGRNVSVTEMMRLISRDRAFWGRGGGLTITGGEPLAQPRFVTSVLELSYEAGINTAIETCAYAPWATLQKALRYLDWVLIDIKHMNSAKHKMATGVDNRLILDNVKRTVGSGSARVLIRIPVVPGFNDSTANMSEAADFLRKIGQDEVNLLPFHRLAISKYEQLGLEYPYKDTQPPSYARLEAIRELFASRGVKCYLGDDTPF